MSSLEKPNGSAVGSGLGAPAVLVGLGNPGPAYERTLHNVGFLVIDHLAARLGAPGYSRQELALSTRTQAVGRPLLLLKPETFMNSSGLAVRPALAGWPNAELFVIHDELDLPFGAVRLKARGGAGGHRGIRSIIEVLGTGDFNRLRIGIQRPERSMDAAEYVLEPVEGDRSTELFQAIELAADALLLALEQGVGVAMNSVNRRVEPG